ncbi:accessory Sec system translocase SecA2 [Lutispora saccharofermentans]|uniref:Protein translocase subunit SecA n=1 Tax=Lutispora saccharofermentans TaxID=3024236 RepID=A0ABT1NEK6_9FIRM|nr:accessory Sec system translocase SecA2 [Lutispora saccharofermentans]MCQ1529679.1 accessory Sec system translocase SecA2 [Lutispora saccharofermentans]
MLKKLRHFNDFIKDWYNPVEYDLKLYYKILNEINDIKLKTLSDNELKTVSRKLKQRAQKGESLDKLLAEAFALVREASYRVLGLYPFDVQIIAGIALHKGKIIEMQTGEGKTLAAVSPAYLNALSGKGVHILTVNDYLAFRDAQWMGPVYEFLGLRAGYIREGMSIEKRQKAYSCDVAYVTAKESGFDYLRDFLCADRKNVAQRRFNYAIVDEADSILIDEARIPLVIAGNVKTEAEGLARFHNIVKGLEADADYEIDQYERNIYLTDAGLMRVEEMLGSGNLYDIKNLELLTKINCALHAEKLLYKDKDYIVRNGRIEIIDEFTGRIADKRHWPDNLQGAVEAKEGIASDYKGKIMGSVALQHFLSLYPRLCGMTGTAKRAAGELNELYGLEVLVIPTNKPCIRIDHEDVIFTDIHTKNKAIIKEVIRANKRCQPVLIGTASIEESENLANDLNKAGVECRILNAKNDAMEAKIIAKAGELGAVTVSTNMAGRGIDIKLGGMNEEQRDGVAALGGLYVIGTSRHESSRIDDQLRGRAGRQGDPGESRFFISFEDGLIKKYGIIRTTDIHDYRAKQQDPHEDASIKRAIEKGQRMVEGYNSDVRRQLWKYSYIIEQQRRIIHNRRQEILHDRIVPELLSVKAADRYYSLMAEVGEEALRKAEKQITLYCINKCWADYLDYISYVQEGIHLVSLGNKNPLDEFHRIAAEAYENMVREIDSEIVNIFNSAEADENGVLLDDKILKGPSSTWTYLMNDSPDQFSRLPYLVKAASTYIKGTLFSVRSIFKK